MTGKIYDPASNIYDGIRLKTLIFNDEKFETSCFRIYPCYRIC
jgi:hypothetical protein